MKVGVISPGRTDEVVRKVKLAERHGYDLFGISDTHLLTQETYATMGIAGHVTDTIDIGPTVTNPVTRHPTVTASAVATVHQHTDGRAFLGISSGDSAVHTVGSEPAGLEELAETIRLCKSLWRGRTAEYDDQTMQLAWLDEGVSPSTTVEDRSEPSPTTSYDIPVAMAAEGPKTLELAGRLADKVVVGLGLLPDVVDYATERIEAGAEAAGRDFGDVDVWCYAHANVGPEYETAIDELKHRLAGVAHHSLQVKMDEKMVPPRFEPALSRLVEAYDPEKHGLPDEDTRELLDSPELTAYLGERYGLAGPPETCLEKIDRLAGTGPVDGILLTPYGDHYEEIDRIGAEIVPSL